MKDALKVYIVVHNFFGPGGTEVNTRHLARVLATLGIDVAVINSYRGPAVLPNVRIYGCLPRDRPHRNESTYRWLPVFQQLLRGSLRILILFVSTLIVSLRACPDMIHAQMVIPTGVPVIFAGFLLRKPVVVSARGSDLNIFAARPLLSVIARIILKHASAIIVLTPDLREKAIRLGAAPGKVALIPNGVDVERFDGIEASQVRDLLRLEPREKIILFVGALASYRFEVKGLGYLISALRSVVSTVENVKVLVIGVGAEDSRIDKAALDGIKQQIKFMGVVPYDDMPKYYRVSDLYVNPSLSEGMPTSILEAMAARKPIVAFDIPGCRDLIRDGLNGYLVPKGDVETLAQKISQLLMNSELAERMGSRGRELVENGYSWNEVSIRTLRVYTEVLQKLRKGDPTPVTL